MLPNRRMPDVVGPVVARNAQGVDAIALPLAMETDLRATARLLKISKETFGPLMRRTRALEWRLCSFLAGISRRRCGPVLYSSEIEVFIHQYIYWTKEMQKAFPRWRRRWEGWASGRHNVIRSMQRLGLPRNTFPPFIPAKGPWDYHVEWPVYGCPHPLFHPLMLRQPRRGHQLLMDFRTLHSLLERLEEIGHNDAVDHINMAYVVLDPDNWLEAEDSDDAGA